MTITTILKRGESIALELHGSNGQGSSADGWIVRFAHVPSFTDDNQIDASDTLLTDEETHEAVCDLLEKRDSPMGRVADNILYAGVGYVAQLISPEHRIERGVTDDEIVGRIEFTQGGVA
jgi:hypothetical protein